MIGPVTDGFFFLRPSIQNLFRSLGNADDRRTKAISISAGKGNETHSRFSPNGKWVAYVSDESGRPEVYVQVFPVAASGKFQISTAGGDMPIWRKDGKELFYLVSGGNLMAVEVQTDSQFESALPRILFKTEILETGSTSFRNHYLPSADGRRFIVNQSAEGSNPIWITTNWRDDLPKSR